MKKIKKKPKKPKKIILLAGILGLFALLDIFVGIYDVILGLPIVGISGRIFGSSLISMGIALLISVYWIWNNERKGYFLAMLIISADMVISSAIFLLKLPSDEKLLFDIIIDFCLIAGILYILGIEKKEEERKLREWN